MTNELRQFIDTRPWPKRKEEKLIIDVIQEDWVGDQYEPHLKFILYRDNFNLFTPDQQMHIANILQEVHKKVRDSGVPTTLEVQAHVPRN